jgi:hypothetical protein
LLSVPDAGSRLTPADLPPVLKIKTKKYSPR